MDFHLIGYCVSGAFLVFLTLWLLAVRKGNAGLVDVGWTLGVGLSATFLGITCSGWGPRRLLVGAMGTMWALRLVGYILVDRVIGTTEDGRYRRMREYWGRRANVYFLFFFLAQAPLVGLFALPFMPAFSFQRVGFSVWEFAGMVVWVVAVCGEMVADNQLRRFRANQSNRGKTCREGLWRYSRHPNYFFEWLHWWAYVIMAVGMPHGWVALVGPVAMFAFLMRLTGIPHTEKQALASRGDDYRDYQKTTSMFIPRPPKRRVT